MIAIIKSIVSALVAFVCMLTSSFAGDFAAGYEPSKADCKMNFAVISDIHMTEDAARRDMLELGLYDMDSAENKLDALVLAGDMTERARLEQYVMLNEAFSKYTPAESIIMAIGNHDTWNDSVDDDHEFVESKKLFIEYNKKIADREIEKVYYSTYVDGYRFIVMSSEYNHTDAYISPEQLAWLDGELASVAEGEPVFVVSHWPMSKTHGLPLTWLDNPIFEDKSDLEDNDGSFGNETEEVEAILQKYKNVFLISGHLHNGIANNNIYGYSSVETHGNVTSINLPSYMYPGIKGSVSNGNGFVFEVYDDEVIIRARSFTGGAWLTNYCYNIPLV